MAETSRTRLSGKRRLDARCWSEAQVQVCTVDWPMLGHLSPAQLVRQSSPTLVWGTWRLVQTDSIVIRRSQGDHRKNMPSRGMKHRRSLRLARSIRAMGPTLSRSVSGCSGSGLHA